MAVTPAINKPIGQAYIAAFIAHCAAVDNIVQALKAFDTALQAIEAVL